MKSVGPRTVLNETASSEERAVAAFLDLRSIVARLFAPDGCPSARIQTHTTLAPHLIEEAREVAEVIESLGTQPVPARVRPGMVLPQTSLHLAEELGDLLWQVLTHTVLAEQEGWFTLADVLEMLAQKMTRRHPHIFGAAHASTPAEVDALWAMAKRAERAERNDTHGATVSP